MTQLPIDILGYCSDFLSVPDVARSVSGVNRLFARRVRRRTACPHRVGDVVREVGHRRSMVRNGAFWLVLERAANTLTMEPLGTAILPHPMPCPPRKRLRVIGVPLPLLRLNDWDYTAPGDIHDILCDIRPGDGPLVPRKSGDVTIVGSFHPVIDRWRLSVSIDNGLYRPGNPHTVLIGYGTSVLNFYQKECIEDLIPPSKSVIIACQDLSVAELHRYILLAQEEIWVPFSLMNFVCDFIEPAPLLKASYRNGRYNYTEVEPQPCMWRRTEPLVAWEGYQNRLALYRGSRKVTFPIRIHGDPDVGTVWCEHRMAPIVQTDIPAGCIQPDDRPARDVVIG
jgi:hypothetical protein